VNLQIDGKRALISGATSGIGLAIATTLADEGAAVIIAGRSKEKLNAPGNRFNHPLEKRQRL